MLLEDPGRGETLLYFSVRFVTGIGFHLWRTASIDGGRSKNSRDDSPKKLREPLQMKLEVFPQVAQLPWLQSPSACFPQPDLQPELQPDRPKMLFMHSGRAGTNDEKF